MSAYTISDAGLKLIEQFEGLRLDAYLDSVNVPTIGYGHIRGVQLGDSCTPEQANKWLQDDAGWAAAGVNQLVTVDISQNQFDALCSFAFNLGVSALRNSTLLRKLNAGDTDGAAQEFGKWCHAGAEILPGLVRRREAERELFEREDHA